MTPSRLSYKDSDPEAHQALRALETYVRRSSLARPLVELLHTRVSQMNGCAYCLDMHTKEARTAGETEQRLYALSAWRETAFFSASERAALAWAEAVTLLGKDLVPDAVFEEARRHFEERELVELTIATVTINAWNRLAIAFRMEPGSYTAGSK